MQTTLSIFEAGDTRRGMASRRAGRAGLAACIALIAGLGIATHLPAVSHAAHGSTSISHTYVVINAPDTVTGGPGSV